MYYYLIIINVVTLLAYGIDKYKAQHHKWRISEFNLLALAAIGGAAGAVAGMWLFHHKTKHKKFLILVPLFFIIWVMLLAYLYTSILK
jgi:uncharacterized membrane protein YsdA (DUF1294 family)